MKGTVTALVIIAAVVFLFVWLFSRRIRAVLIYNGDDITLAVRFLFVKITLLPQKADKINLRKYSAKNFRRQNKPNKKKKSPPPPQIEKKEKLTVDSIRVKLALITDISHDVLKRISKYARVDVDKLNIVVASDEAAVTGIAYGVVSQAVSYLLTVLGVAVEMHADNVSVSADFTSDKPLVRIKLTISIRAAHAPVIALSCLFKYFDAKQADMKQQLNETHINKSNGEKNG